MGLHLTGSSLTTLNNAYVRPLSKTTASSVTAAPLPWVQATDYGVTVNDNNDNTTALASALTALASGGTLLLPRGTIKQTGQLAFDPRKVAVRGAGAGQTFLDVSGIAAGTAAWRIGWDNAAGPFDVRRPSAMSHLTLNGPTTGSPCDGIAIEGAGASPQASDFTLDHVSLIGFANQVRFGSNAFLVSFHGCRFRSATTYGVTIPNTVTTTGERLTFTDCTFDNTAGAAFNSEWSGVDAYFFNCAFDYLAKALRLRRGRVNYVGCHFETGTTYGGAGTSFLDIARDGSNFPPAVVLSGCYLYGAWDNYAAFAILGGSTFGGSTLIISNTTLRTSATSATYLVRDDAPSASTWIVDNLIYDDTTYRVQGRTFAGASVTLTENERWVNGLGTQDRIAKNTAHAASALPSGYYFFPGYGGETGTGNSWANGNFHCYPVYLPPGTVTRMGLEVTTAGTAGCTIRLGIYADAGNIPGALVLDAGTVAADTTGVKEVTVSQVLTGGIYWIGGAVQGTPATVPTVRTVSGSPRGDGLMQIAGTTIPAAAAFNVAIRSSGGATAALSTPFVFGNAHSVAPRIFFKAA